MEGGRGGDEKKSVPLDIRILSSTHQFSASFQELSKASNELQRCNMTSKQTDNLEVQLWRFILVV